jgi:hypothetical protein
VQSIEQTRGQEMGNRDPTTLDKKATDTLSIEYIKHITGCEYAVGCGHRNRINQPPNALNDGILTDQPKGSTPSAVEYGSIGWNSTQRIQYNPKWWAA